MLSRNKTLSSMQKTYDDCYLVCSTAVYFETQNNEAEALRSWKNALEQINYHNAYRIPAGHKPKSETERALMDSLRQMEEQCKERVDLLETLKKSREEAEERAKEGSSSSLPLGMGMGTGTGRVTGYYSEGVNGWLGGGTVPPSSYESLSRPPPLPVRPPISSRHASYDGGPAQRTASSTSVLPQAELPTLTPFASNPRPPPKPSRTPSPDKNERSMLRTLRPGGETRKKALPIRQKAPVPAAKAAAQAWVPARPSFSASLPAQPSDEAAKAASRSGLSPVNAANTKLPRDRNRSSRVSEPTLFPYRKEYTRPQGPPGIDSATAIAAARRRHGRTSSPGVSPGRDLSDDDSPPMRRSFEVSGSSQDERQRRKRKPVPKKKTEDEPVIIGDDSSSSPASKTDDNAESDSLISPEERLWKEKVSRLMKNLPKGVDKAAAQQILNEIVVQGDPVHWNDVAGLDVAKNALKENVVYPFLRPDLFMGLREPARGMLLFGPPGTGKTMLARAVATESRSTFFAISASSLTSKFLGESEKLVRALFQLAKALAPSIIFVDEIDSLLSARGDSGEHEATRRIKTEFLIQWSDLARAAAGRETSDKDRERGDASRVLVLAATNMPWAIDEAARRRFVRRQYIPLPEEHVRKLQIENLLSHQKHSLTGREIDRLVRLTEGKFCSSDSFYSES
jgi:SpoVK/Ycf46/Vps4 family AAA+-type ATPase